MPLETTTYPHSFNTLHASGSEPTYVVFWADVDKETGEMWCPDCRATKSHLTSYFTPHSAPRALVYWVGDKPTWKDPKNEARVLWAVKSVPTVLRMQEGKETKRIEMYDILDEKKWEAFVAVE